VKSTRSDADTKDLSAKVGTYLKSLKEKKPTMKDAETRRLEFERDKEIKRELQNDKMDARFSLLLTNPSCPAALVEEMTAHFTRQLKSRAV
jgi:hypothetical protein